MGGCVDGWICEWVDGQILAEWVDSARWTDGWVVGCVDSQVGALVDGCVGKWMDGWMDRVDGWISGLGGSMSVKTMKEFSILWNYSYILSPV